LVRYSKKYFVSQDIVENISNKLEKFEINNEFLKKGITLNTLASYFGTNTKYLSTVIHDYKKRILINILMI
jgi:YesN/AraC family two-component response regulator